MPDFVKKMTAIGVHGRFDMRVDFQPGINVVYGHNGTGKTTLVHILANALNRDYARFAWLLFDTIRIDLDGESINLKRQQTGPDETLVVKENRKIVFKESVKDIVSREHRRAMMRRRRHGPFIEVVQGFEPYGATAELTQAEVDAPGLTAAYFPAFRTMIDAWVSAAEGAETSISRQARARRAGRVTLLAREWFGHFVPFVNYPSLQDIEAGIADEIEAARLEFLRADRKLLTKAFLDVVSSLALGRHRQQKKVDVILEAIRELYDRLGYSLFQAESTLVTEAGSELGDLYEELTLEPETEWGVASALEAFYRALQELVDVQERASQGIQHYLESVNRFLEGKRLTVDPSIRRGQSGAVGVAFHDQEPTLELRALSSGERQIVTLVYAASHMGRQKVVLVDEPEISLHVDWQRELLGRMSGQMAGRQTIACTHSPVIGADYEDRVKELSFRPTATPRIEHLDENALLEKLGGEEEIPF